MQSVMNKIGRGSSVIAMKRTVTAIAAVIVMAVGAIGVGTAIETSTDSAPAAEASSNGGIYIVTPKSWGWCPNVAKVYNRPYYLTATNFTSGDTRGESGDDIIWVGVQLNKSNRIQVNVGCSLGYYSTGTLITITPRRNGQAFFVSPSGTAWGN
jgi:hypothetical protein